MAVQLPDSDPKNVLQDCLFLAKAYATMRLKDSSYYFIKVAATIAARRPFSDAAANAAVFSVIGELYLVHGEAPEAERMCVLCTMYYAACAVYPYTCCMVYVIHGRCMWWKYTRRTHVTSTDTY